MTSLFDGEPMPLPSASGSTWTVTSTDAPPPPPVRHAQGYDAFTAFAGTHDTPPADLLDTWRFAHFIRRARIRMWADDGLRRSAVVFLGNCVNRFNADLRWGNSMNQGLYVANDTEVEEDPGAPGRWRTVPEPRYLGVEGTVDAILDATLDRFREFGRVVDDYGWTRPETLRPV